MFRIIDQSVTCVRFTTWLLLEVYWLGWTLTQLCDCLLHNAPNYYIIIFLIELPPHFVINGAKYALAENFIKYPQGFITLCFDY